MAALSVVQPANRHLQYLTSRTIFQRENCINIFKHFFLKTSLKIKKYVYRHSFNLELQKEYEQHRKKCVITR